MRSVFFIFERRALPQNFIQLSSKFIKILVEKNRSKKQSKLGLLEFSRGN